MAFGNVGADLRLASDNSEKGVCEAVRDWLTASALLVGGGGLAAALGVGESARGRPDSSPAVGVKILKCINAASTSCSLFLGEVVGQTRPRLKSGKLSAPGDALRFPLFAVQFYRYLKEPFATSL